MAKEEDIFPNTKHPKVKNPDAKTVMSEMVFIMDIKGEIHVGCYNYRYKLWWIEAMEYGQLSRTCYEGFKWMYPPKEIKTR